MSTGKCSLYTCQRCGFDYKWNEIRQETGTKMFVCPQCFDYYDRVNHPQNGPPPKRDGELVLSRVNKDPDLTPESTWTPQMSDTTWPS